MKNSSSLLYGFLLLIGDFLALIGAFALAYIIRVKIDDRPLIEQIPAPTFFAVFAVLLIFWLLIFALLDLYRSRVYENRIAEAGRVLLGSFIGILFLTGCEYVLDRPIFPARLVMLYGLIIGFLMVLLFRTIARATKHILYGYGVGLNHVLLVGNTPVMRELVLSLQHPLSGYKIVGIVGDRRQKYGDLPAKNIYGSFAEAVSKLKKVTVHSIVQTELYAEQEKNEQVLGYAQKNHIAYRFVPGNGSLFVGKIEVDLFQNIPIIAVHQTALTGWGRVIKRLFDLLAGSLLLILAMPVIVLVCLLLFVFDHGQPMYRQKRLTRFNNQIRVFKIRTYRHKYHRMTPEEAFTKIGRPELAVQYRRNGDFLDNDPRISRIGRFLRKTSLDELPQLINVVKGDISLVGPRPLEPFELESYPQKNIMLSVKTGLTGLAVISGRRDIPVEERRRIDLYYVQNWSFWLDINILLKTVVMVLRGDGAR